MRALAQGVGSCRPLLLCLGTGVLALLVAPRVFRAPEAPAAVCAGVRRPARESSAPRASLGASSRSPGQAPPPPTDTEAAPSGALHTGGAVSLECGWVRRLEARPGVAIVHCRTLSALLGLT